METHQDSSPTRRSWLAPLFIIFVVVLGYGIAPGRLPLVGEETCRALHGIEMAETGDWLIATNQGVPILDRPPLQYWTLAVIHKWIHPLDPMTLRLFMMCVTLATSLVIWTYASQFVSSTGALLAAVAYPTMGHVFDLGRRAETDGLFTLLLASALLAWHYGYALRRPPLITWTLAMALAALATLTKGIQAPVAFFGAVYLFLLIKWDWRSLLSWAHAAGILVFLAMIAAWQVPFWFEAGWEGTRSTWFQPATDRVSASAGALAKHLSVFPLKVLIATLPWSPLLLALLDPQFWKMKERQRSCTIFMIVGMLAILGPVWLSVGGHHRYIMPMYPLLAVVCGVVTHRSLSLDMSRSLRRFWRDYVRILAVAFVLIAAMLAVATIAAQFSDAYWAATLAQPWWLLAMLIASAILGGFSLFRLSARVTPEPSLAAPFIIATLLALFFNGAMINALAANAANAGPEIVKLRDSLPEDTRLVSFRPAFHKFVYWYGHHIEILPWPDTAADVPTHVDYFALTVKRDRKIDLPFQWDEIARFSMDRTNKNTPEMAVVVGRIKPRKPDAADRLAP